MESRLNPAAWEALKNEPELLDMTESKKRRCMTELLFDALDAVLSINWSALFKKAGDFVISATFALVVIYWLIKFGGAIFRFLWVL